MKFQYYYLVIAEGIEPRFKGPYDSLKTLNRKVKTQQKSFKEFDDILGVAFNEKGIPEVWSYPTSFFETN
jgi:hypothetical protein